VLNLESHRKNRAFDVTARAGPRWSDQGSLTTALEVFLFVPR
jgi:hypothetical protein